MVGLGSRTVGIGSMMDSSEGLTLRIFLGIAPALSRNTYDSKDQSLRRFRFLRLRTSRSMSHSLIGCILLCMERPSLDTLDSLGC